jgi:hypothetical protein
MPGNYAYLNAIGRCPECVNIRRRMISRVPPNAEAEGFAVERSGTANTLRPLARSSY